MLRDYPSGPRVRLRALEPADAEALSRIRDDPRVARYQSWTHCTLQDAEALIQQTLPPRQATPGRWSQFAIVLRKSGTLIGDCGLRNPAMGSRQAEIGFTLSRKYWGKGYATEAVGVLVDWLFRDRGKRRVFAITDARNVASWRLLERLGFHRDPRFDRLVWFKGEFGPESVWVIERQPRRIPRTPSV